MIQKLNEWLAQVEWYDNHRLSIILECRRKAYWHLLHRGGLAQRVGPGAHAGSTVHAGIAAYEAGWGRIPESERRLDAFEAMRDTHNRVFGQLREEGFALDSRHELDNLVDIMDTYFDRFLEEDHLYRPIQSEMAMCVPIRPQAGDPLHFTDPFWYILRMDGLWRREATGDLYVMETKTTSGGVKRELTRHQINRQGTGYVWAVRQFPEGEACVGVLVNVVGILKDKRDYARDVETKSQTMCESWRRQTINIVEDWRELLRRAKTLTLQERLDMFYQDDKQCMNYGLCPFHDACYFGPVFAESMPTNTWTPFQVQQPLREAVESE